MPDEPFLSVKDLDRLLDSVTLEQDADRLLGSVTLDRDIIDSLTFSGEE